MLNHQNDMDWYDHEIRIYFIKYHYIADFLPRYLLYIHSLFLIQSFIIYYFHYITLFHFFIFLLCNKAKLPFGTKPILGP